MTPIDLIAIVRAAAATITPAEILAIVISLAASVTDIKSKKIPNWLTFPGALGGILCRWWQTSTTDSQLMLRFWIARVA